ncbi:hypothetical protein H6771_00965 [Candidatus Peribacteria bacterium]|nr:hypothetical protein [Candidatus Peribacteria bacterium]
MADQSPTPPIMTVSLPLPEELFAFPQKRLILDDTDYILRQSFSVPLLTEKMSEIIRETLGDDPAAYEPLYALLEAFEPECQFREEYYLVHDEVLQCSSIIEILEIPELETLYTAIEACIGCPLPLRPVPHVVLFSTSPEQCVTVHSAADLEYKTLRELSPEELMG